MRCFICDRVDDAIQYDKVRDEYGPCTVCQAIIADCLSDFDQEDEEEEYVPD